MTKKIKKKITKKQVDLVINFNFDLNEKNEKSIKIEINERVEEELSKIQQDEKLGFYTNGSISNFFSKSKKVCNSYRYQLIKSTNNKYDLYYFYEDEINNRIDRNLNDDNDLPTILILLESPHEKEYEYDYKNKTIIPIAPAQGSTGVKLFDNLDIVFNIINSLIESKNQLEKKEYRVIIYNPIPYQTSLHFLHRQAINSSSIYKILRDKVWLGLWDNDVYFKKEFKKFIKKYNPELVINSCTSKLKSEVNKELNKILSIPHIFSTNHPSAWWNEYNIIKIR